MRTFIRTLLPFLSLCSLANTYVVQADGGTVHFQGQIVESPCEYQPIQRQVNVTCYHDGRSQVKAIPLNTMLKGKADANHQGVATLHWIDKDKKAAIITVEYK